jgi:hypothetical protein
LLFKAKIEFFSLLCFECGYTETPICISFAHYMKMEEKTTSKVGYYCTAKLQNVSVLP